MPEIHYDITRDAFPVTDNSRTVAVLYPRTRAARALLAEMAAEAVSRRMVAWARRERERASRDA